MNKIDEWTTFRNFPLGACLPRPRQCRSPCCNLGQCQGTFWNQTKHSHEHWLCSPNCGVGTQSSTSASLELGTTSGLAHPQPKPGSPLHLGAWVGCKVKQWTIHWSLAKNWNTSFIRTLNLIVASCITQFMWRIMNFGLGILFSLLSITLLIRASFSSWKWKHLY